MTKNESIYSEMIANIAKIEKLNIDNLELQSQLEKIELEDWQPVKGDFVIASSGIVFDRTQWIGRNKSVPDQEVEFGSVRETIQQAKLAAANIKRFNRLSCFMGDSMPILEYSPISVALVFYDYEEEQIKKLKKILAIRKEL